MDAEGNIYNLNGDFIGTTNGDAEEDGDEGEFQVPIPRLYLNLL